MMANEQLLQEIRTFREAHPHVRFVDLICLDIPGHFYGKRYPMDMLEKVAAGSVLKLPQNCIILGAQGGIFNIGDYGFSDGDPDVARRLIPGTLKPVNWESQPLAQMLISSDGTEAPIEFEPREVLARVVRRLNERGLFPIVAFELEFYLCDNVLEQGLATPPCDRLAGQRDDQPCMHIDRLARFSDVLTDIADTARLQGIESTVITAEIAPGQFEINFGHSDDPLQAADWSAMFCRLTRAVARKHGYRASFMAKPYLEFAGSGMHLHVSLYNRGGENVLAANQQAPLRHAVAGCLELLPHLMPIYAPNHNSYRRFGSNLNSARFASWGFEDRDACVRIPDSDQQNLRLEFRLPGADANPYLVLAALLSSLEQGLAAQREPIAPLNEDRSSGIDFPTDVLEGVRQMQQHEAVNALLGAEFVKVYCENKRQDHLAFMHDIGAREYRWYL